MMSELMMMTVVHCNAEQRGMTKIDMDVYYKHQKFVHE
jgi:hypothetical protein